MTYRYLVHGLSVLSDIELPELRRDPSEVRFHDKTDVRISVGDSPRELEHAQRSANGYVVGRDEVLFRVPSVGRFWARGGTALTVDAELGADPGALRVYILGSGLAAVLHQRGLFPLHASAFKRDGCCIGFMGDSGNGKSTLAAMLSRRGFQLISDDVLVPKIAEDGAVFAPPGVPILKLWPDALGPAGLTSLACEVDSADLTKYRLRASKRYDEACVPMTRLYLLRWLVPRSAAPEFIRLAPFEAMMALRQNLYQSGLVGAMGAERAFLAFGTRLLSKVGVFAFRRAMDIDRSDAQVELLIKHIGADWGGSQLVNSSRVENCGG